MTRDDCRALRSTANELAEWAVQLRANPDDAECIKQISNDLRGVRAFRSDVRSVTKREQVTAATDAKYKEVNEFLVDMDDIYVDLETMSAE